MEQTTEGTISYRRSISWSHLRPSSAKPSSWLVDVMLAKIVVTLRTARAKGGGDVSGRLDQWASPIETCLPAKKRHGKKEWWRVRMGESKRKSRGESDY